MLCASDGMSLRFSLDPMSSTDLGEYGREEIFSLCGVDILML